MSAKDTPISTFESLSLPPYLLETLKHLGYKNATAIQSGTIPALLEGSDVVGIAQTGTGKTAAFALPTIAMVDVALRKPQVLVLCPTRELSMQVAEAFKTYARGLNGFKVLTVCGGADMRQQLRALKDGVHVVVATPGRLLDHLERGTADFSHTRTVVLDEADEMLRMGFIDDVDTILAKTPKQRRVALFSATMPPRIREIAKRHLKNPVEVAVTAASTTNENIEQYYWLAKGASKIEALTRLLAFEDTEGVIVFTRTRESTSAVSELLRQRGFKAAALNGDMDQKVRVRTVEQLKSGSLDIVVATDVAARGLDVERITHVINFDIPFDEEAYVHRIGRTGRAGRTGKAILFVAPRERRMLKNIERLTKQEIPPFKLPSHFEIDRKRQQAFADSVREAIAQPATPLMEKLVDELCSSENCGHRDIAIAALSMLSGTVPAEGHGKGADASDAAPKGQWEDEPPAHKRGRSDSRNDKRRDSAGSSDAKKTAGDSTPSDRNLGRARPLKDHPEVAMERFRIDVGKKHGVQAREIVGAIANEAGIEGQFIGAINILEDCSTVDLPEGMPKAILKHLKKTRVKGVSLGMARVL